MKDTMILKDGTVIELEAGSGLSNMVVVSESRRSMADIWEKLTQENLSKVQIKNSYGLVEGNYENLLLVSETSVANEDGTVSTSYNFREKTEIEKKMDELSNEIILLEDEE